MSKFMFLLRGSCGSQSKQSPEDMQASMQTAMDWMQSGKEEGWLIDPGSALMQNAAVIDPDLVVTDGPYAETKEINGGYSIIEAPDLETACQYAKRTIESVAKGSTIEVREIMDMSGGK